MSDHDLTFVTHTRLGSEVIRVVVTATVTGDRAKLLRVIGPSGRDCWLDLDVEQTDALEAEAVVLAREEEDEDCDGFDPDDERDRRMERDLYPWGDA
jgi:hypothetical protein